MKSTFRIRITPNQFFSDASNFQTVRTTDHISYPEFLNYFKKCDNITLHDLIIGINFTYGWMPTIFEFTSSNLEECIPLLNKVKSNSDLSKEELTLIKSTFNNSLVGTSKLLHFINPESYPIWDSRVYRYLTSTEPYGDRISDPASYWEYVKWIRQLALHPQFNDAAKTVERCVGYKMSNIRVAELVMYSFGGKLVKPK
jgi:hypothetical protein